MASTATPANFSLSCIGIPNFSNVAIISGSTSSSDFGVFVIDFGAA